MIYPKISFSKYEKFWAFTLLSFKNILLFMLLQLSQYFPIHPPPPSHPLTSIMSPLTIVHIHGSLIYVLWIIPFPSFNQSLPPPSPLTAVSLSCDSMSLVLFCSLVYFVGCWTLCIPISIIELFGTMYLSYSKAGWSFCVFLFR